MLTQAPTLNLEKHTLSRVTPIQAKLVASLEMCPIINMAIDDVKLLNI